MFKDILIDQVIFFSLIYTLRYSVSVEGFLKYKKMQFRVGTWTSFQKFEGGKSKKKLSTSDISDKRILKLSRVRQLLASGAGMTSPSCRTDLELSILLGTNSNL